MEKKELPWSPSSYTSNKFKKKQQPIWGDSKKLSLVKKQLHQMPPLVFSGEIENLRDKLKKIANGEGFLLQGGSCAESFADSTGKNIRDDLKITLQMSFLINSLGEKQILRIGRIAGQFAKPRSSDFETVNGEQIYSYRGDMVNDSGKSKAERIPNPEKILGGYFYSASTLNLLRGFAEGGFTSLESVSKWIPKTKLEIKKKIENIQNSFHLLFNLHQIKENQSDFQYFTSHEALLLDYEEMMIRKSSAVKKNKWYGCSAHLLWIGDRTRESDGAHVELLRGIRNPIGVKVGPNYKITDIIKTIKTLNRENEDDKIILIIRMGVKGIGTFFPLLIKEIQKQKLNVIWISDPMHANTFQLGKYKTRAVADIKKELSLFFDICKKNEINPAGVHLEMTGKDVLECVDKRTSNKKLGKKYFTLCDPRLNPEQSLIVALHIAKLIKG